MSRDAPLPLRGQVALVTGSSRGLGREIAMGLASEGANLVIVSRRLEACQRVATEIEQDLGRRAVAMPAHVGDWQGLEGLLDRVEDEFGRLDILVNNAGIAPTYPSLVDVSEELFDKVIQVNLKGPFRLTALAGSRMAAAGSGSIVNISSIAATRPTPEDLPYAAAKAGLNALTAGFAQAYGPAVRVNTILAGPFFTDISRDWDMDAFHDMAERWPMRRGGDPKEIVGAALYLAGPAASYTTGAVLPVDGGRTITP